MMVHVGELRWDRRGFANGNPLKHPNVITSVMWVSIIARSSIGPSGNGCGLINGAILESHENMFFKQHGVFADILGTFEHFRLQSAPAGVIMASPLAPICCAPGWCHCCLSTPLTGTKSPSCPGVQNSSPWDHEWWDGEMVWRNVTCCLRLARWYAMNEVVAGWKLHCRCWSIQPTRNDRRYDRPRHAAYLFEISGA